MFQVKLTASDTIKFLIIIFVFANPDLPLIYLRCHFRLKDCLSQIKYFVGVTEAPCIAFLMFRITPIASGIINFSIKITIFVNQYLSYIH